MLVRREQEDKDFEILRREAESIFISHTPLYPANTDPMLDDFIPLLGKYIASEFEKITDPNPDFIKLNRWGYASLRTRTFGTDYSPFDINSYEARWDQGRWSLYVAYLGGFEHLTQLEIGQEQRVVKIL